MSTGLRARLVRLLRTMRGRSAYKFLLQEWLSFPDRDLACRVLSTARFSRVVTPLLLEFPQAERICIIAPHTDDETIGPGGTLLKAVEAGKTCHTIYLTTNPPADVTRREAAAAMALGGYTATYFDGAPGRLSTADDVARRLADELAARRPQAIFIPFVLDDAIDHRRANALLLKAAAMGAVPDRTEIWAYQVYSMIPPNVVVDITAVAERKAAMIRCWETQQKWRDWAHYALGMNAFNIRFAPDRDIRYCEHFFVTPMSEYKALCELYFPDDSNIVCKETP